MKLFAVVAALILGAGAVCAQEDFYAGSNWEAPVPPEEFAPEAGGVEAPSPAPRTFLPTPVQPLPESSPLPAPTLPVQGGFAPNYYQGAGQYNTSGPNVQYFGPDGQPLGTTRDIGGGNTQYYDSQGGLEQTTRTVGDTTTYYDSSGQMTGRVEDRGGNKLFYDAAGRLTRREVAQGDATYFYNGNGQPEGRMVQEGDALTYYDSSGRVSERVVTRGTDTYYYGPDGRQTRVLRNY